jgi:predicted dehydrogenase
MSPEPGVSRRHFLKTTAALAALAPNIVPSSVLGDEERAPPSERITVGVIGTGNRGCAVMGEFLAQKDVQVVALSDVKSWALAEAKGIVERRSGGAGCSAHGDFRRLLDRKDIDAVLVATCDHWHVLASMAAAKAKKDVYMEKPMGLSMAECKALRDAMRKNDRVFQFGTQQRSDGKFRLACELARNERIGKLHTINVWSPGSSSGGSTDPAPVPEGLDYDMWLGPAPFKPHTPDRCSNSLWWFISDYALGFIAGWGIHPIDIAVWGAPDRLDVPVAVEGKGEFPTSGVCDTAMNWRIALEFASGVTLNFAGDPKPQEWTKRYPGSQSHGTAFEGSDGWVHVNRSVVNSSPASLVDSKIGDDGIHLTKSPGHVRNFLDCVKSRAKTVSPIDESVRSETLCQISEIAIRLQRKVKWDPKTESFPGDEEANRRLSRPLRAPWKLD